MMMVVERCVGLFVGGRESKMTIKKHGSGEVLKDEHQKTASTWSKEDEEELQDEIKDEDAE